MNDGLLTGQLHVPLRSGGSVTLVLDDVRVNFDDARDVAASLLVLALGDRAEETIAELQDRDGGATQEVPTPPTSRDESPRENGATDRPTITNTSAHACGCGRSFATPRGLSKHRSAAGHQPAARQPITTPLEQIAGQGEQRSVEPYRCGTCPSSYPSLPALRRHTEGIHQRPPTVAERRREVRR